MKITKNKLSLSSSKNLPQIIHEIRENLARMGVDSLSIDIRYDPRQNVSLVNFNFKGKSYEMRLSNQKDVRMNMYALSLRVEYKARMHLLGIETFDIGISPYLMIEGPIGGSHPQEVVKGNPRYYAVLNIPEYSSNSEIIQAYKKLVKAFHPDMALSSEAKMEFEKRMAQINEAYGEIKKERGI